MTTPLATVGILSIGEMGTGIAKLLIAHNFRVVTNLEGRSNDTKTRALSASIEIVKDDKTLVSASDYILSIVPPRDALDTASRISSAFNSQSQAKSTPLCYFDLNAISPRSAREIGELFAKKSPAIQFLDGGIIGGTPRLKDDKSPSTTVSSHPTTTTDWAKPSIPISGPLSQTPPSSFATFSTTLGLNHISDDIGIASGLKCSFASLTKGFTALVLQSFTTANNLGVLPLLISELEQRAPGLRKAANSVTGMPPKAYRWVREMEEIGITHAEEGGFVGAPSSSGNSGVFNEIAQVYRSVADDTVLGDEKTERRKRGLTIEDVATAMGEGLRAKRRKEE
ncbi:6-phosphogluconate dehydrogenase C-terminal [Glarea lozoyensis ATCC 20868]|uniref:6-phosphogluconate dehydrogenase C-terminal n=1 Tax=Glarea lozoyensis (strain ATCC 20868 / MF5171) TaxID=1116229 RepID=S3D1D9_GLAL2|nr:6-phosphogluconate dehydrogenase C-terminal [Glarea lozoyensis ATCC 20868]EPE25826.1 6-phosphogluconate dehydrogenase C-terminal [Glarea lozoyensis ATCC 20868]